MKIRYTFPVDTELIGRAKGGPPLYRGAFSERPRAGLVRGLERSGARMTYRGRRIRLRPGRLSNR